MKELLEAAKAVIDNWDKHWPLDKLLNDLKSAVERADNPPADYNEWTSKNSGKVLSAHEVWTAAQQADRERIKDIIAAIGVSGKNECWDCCETILEKIDATTE